MISKVYLVNPIPADGEVIKRAFNAERGGEGEAAKADKATSSPPLRKTGWQGSAYSVHVPMRVYTWYILSPPGPRGGALGGKVIDYHVVNLIGDHTDILGIYKQFTWGPFACT